MGLAERLAAHQNKEEEDDRPLTEDEELAKRMAERSWAERQEEPEGLKRIKRMGKQMAPDRTSAHLAMRFGARAALLEAFRDAQEKFDKDLEKYNEDFEKYLEHHRKKNGKDKNCLLYTSPSPRD